MRITRLTLERYGSFTDRVLDFRPGAPLHVVLGANESGKTTALSAIADLLFGFEHFTKFNFRHDGKTLRVGAELLLANGRSLQLRRRKGNKNTLVDAGDQPLPDDLLVPYLGGLTRDTFTREFGLTAEALRRGGEELFKAGGKLAETLAAGSAGLAALTGLRAALNGEADSLFTPRKSEGKPFYQAAARHEKADRALREAIVTADALRDAEARIAETRQAKDNLVAEHEAAGRELARLQRHARTHGSLAEIDRLTAALAEFADLPGVTPQTLARWHAAHEEDRAAAEELDRLGEADARDLAAIAEFGVDERLLDHAAQIDGLRERLGAIRKAAADLPKRMEAQRAAQSELDELARRLGLPSHEEVVTRRPSDLALTHARELIGARSGGEARLHEAGQRLRKAADARDGLQSQAGRLAHPVDPAPVRQRLEAVAHVVGDSERHRREMAECRREASEIDDAARSLLPPVPSCAALASLPLPGEAEIAAYVAASADLAGGERDARRTLAAAQSAVADAEAELARLDGAAAGIGPADLQTARASRDAAFERLRQVLDGDPAMRGSVLAEVRSYSRQADAIADLLLSDRERAALRQTAESGLVAARTQCAAVAASVDEIARRQAELDAAWRELWSPSGLAPRPPQDMAGWLRKAQVLLDRRRRLAVRKAELDSLAEAIERSQRAIHRLLADHGRAADAAAAAELLYREASGWLLELQTGWTAAQVRDESLRNALAKVSEAETEAADIRNQLAAITAEWPAAMMAIGLPGTASVAEASTALEIWQHVGEPKLRLERERRSVEGIHADMATFGQDVVAITALASPAPQADDPPSVVIHLAGLLEQARSGADRRDVLRQAVAGRQSARAGLLARRESLAETLEGIRDLFGLADGDDVSAILERLEQRQDLADRRTTEVSRLTTAGDGLAEAVIRAEQSGIDPDMVPGDIDRLSQDARLLLSRISEASVEHDRAQKARDDLEKGRNATGALREREEAAQDMLTIARRWIVRAAAARLAGQAIERHRQLNQDPILERAGSLFRLATAGEFEGLVVDFGDDDHPALAALRRTGERVAITGLSEGARDQLFLALRLALIELRSAEPLPFVADDLLSSFDEARTACALRLLAALGAKSQVIVFTHHAHVAELARGIAADADVIGL